MLATQAVPCVAAPPIVHVHGAPHEHETGTLQHEHATWAVPHAAKPCTLQHEHGQEHQHQHEHIQVHQHEHQQEQHQHEQHEQHQQHQHEQQQQEQQHHQHEQQQQHGQLQQPEQHEPQELQEQQPQQPQQQLLQQHEHEQAPEPEQERQPQQLQLAADGAGEIAEPVPTAPPRRRRALHLFSGRKGRVDGLAACLVARGWDVDEVDSGKDVAGEAVSDADDLLDDAVFAALLARAEAGHWAAVVAGVPCSTFSVARHRRRRRNGPPVVRRLPGEGRGLRSPPAGHEHEAARANELARRACDIAEAVQAAGGVYIIENPIDRSDEAMSARLKLGHWPSHASLWQLDEIVALQCMTGGLIVHFPQCALGGAAQKWTTLLYSPTLATLAGLGELRCYHRRDEHIVVGRGRDADGAWVTAKLAAYPTGMNRVVADALDGAVPADEPAAEATPAVLGDTEMDRGADTAAVGEAASETVVESRLAHVSQTALDDRLAHVSQIGADRQAAAGRAFAKHEACLWVSADAADTTEGVPCTVAEVHYDDGDPYYTITFADGGERETVAARLRGAPVVGSSRPHAQLAEALDAHSPPHVAATMSLRNNEPELFGVLEREPLPAANVPTSTGWFDVERDEGVPEPLTTDQLIPTEVQAAVAQHIAQVRRCYERAERGEHGWRVARDMRPPPLEFSEAEAMHPAGRGWSWQRHKDGLWRPLTKSRWPDDPPESDLDIEAVLAAAKADPVRFGTADVDFPDQFVLACMAHGYPAPELARATVLGYPHVGALKSMAGLRKCLEKDRKQDAVAGARAWTEHGGAMPQVWPMRADPVNVTWRNGKPRVTIDKTMSLSDCFESYNAAVDLEQFDPVEMVRVQELCRAAAILLTAHVGVRVWSFDLEAYFRRIGKQRADWWKSGYVLPDGYGFDKRVQFGQKEAPVLTSRQSNFLVWAMRRELYSFDQEHPPRDARLLAWRLLRTTLADARPAEERGTFDDPWASLHFIMEYVDDVGAACVDDLLYDVAGTPMYMRNDEQLDRLVPCDSGDAGAVHARRPDAHYHVALTTIEAFGHTSAAGKGVRPTLEMDLLGVHVNVSSYQRLLTATKCEAYGGAVRAALDASPVAGGGLKVPYVAFNSIVHKLLHAASTVVLGRQHLHHCMAARRAVNRLQGKFVLLHAPQVVELQWWLAQLDDPTRHCLPLASRVTFPDVGTTGVLVGYSDAARELASPLTSGYGAWTVINNTFYYVSGLWTPSELAGYSINVLELAAENMGTFSFVAQARDLGMNVTHSLDFVDNTAAEYSADRGSARVPGMQELVRRRFDALDRLGVYSMVERITSVDNDWADALSRGEERMHDVLRMARALGWATRRLYPHRDWRELSGLPRLDA